MMEPTLIDTHAHIYLPELDAYRQRLIEAAASAGIHAIYMPAIDSTTHKAMLDTAAVFPICKTMMGLHPCSVNEDVDKELELVENYLQQQSFYAIGEIGLDFYWDTTFAQQQYKAFNKQLAMAVSYGLPVVIHSRNATDECIEVVQGYPQLKGVFHCFSGSAAQAKKITDLNFMLGIGGVITFKNAGLDKVVHAIGLDNLVLETDAPYLAPVPYRGKRNEPSYLRLVAQKIAAVLDVDLATVAAVTTANAEKLFQVSKNH